MGLGLITEWDLLSDLKLNVLTPSDREPAKLKKAETRRKRGKG